MLHRGDVESELYIEISDSFDIYLDQESLRTKSSQVSADDARIHHRAKAMRRRRRIAQCDTLLGNEDHTCYIVRKSTVVGVPELLRRR